MKYLRKYNYAYPAKEIYRTYICALKRKCIVYKESVGEADIRLLSLSYDFHLLSFFFR